MQWWGCPYGLQEKLGVKTNFALCDTNTLILNTSLMFLFLLVYVGTGISVGSNCISRYIFYYKTAKWNQNMLISFRSYRERYVIAYFLQLASRNLSKSVESAWKLCLQCPYELASPLVRYFCALASNERAFYSFCVCQSVSVRGVHFTGSFCVPGGAIDAYSGSFQSLRQGWRQVKVFSIYGCSGLCVLYWKLNHRHK